MSTSTWTETARRAAAKTAHAVSGIENATEAVEEVADKAKRAARRGRRALEDAGYEASLTVRKHPLESVAVVYLAGLFTGLTVGFVVARRRTSDGAELEESLPFEVGASELAEGEAIS